MGKVINFPLMSMLVNRLTELGFDIFETKLDDKDDSVSIGIGLKSGCSATLLVELSDCKGEKDLWYLYIKGFEEETSPGWNGTLADIFNGISAYTARENKNLPLIGAHHMALHMVTILWNILELIPNQQEPIQNAFDGDVYLQL